MKTRWKVINYISKIVHMIIAKLRYFIVLIYTNNATLNRMGYDNSQVAGKEKTFISVGIHIRTTILQDFYQFYTSI